MLGSMRLPCLLLALFATLSLGCPAPKEALLARPRAPGEAEAAKRVGRSQCQALVKIATFNIQIFGKAKAAKPEVMEVLVKVIRSYDLVAVQEIKDVSQQAPAKLLDAINKEAGPRYALALSPRSGQQPDDKKSQEQYGYFYNTETVRQLGEGALFDDSAKDLFQREPWVAGVCSGGEFLPPPRNKQVISGPHPRVGAPWSAAQALGRACVTIRPFRFLHNF
jgi:hypothetical protein